MAGRHSQRSRSSVVRQGEIYELDLDPTEGHEQQGFRPVLVISKTALNSHIKVAIAVPITNGGKFIKTLGLSVLLPETLQTKGKVLVCSPRTIDFNARNAEYIETVPDDFLKDILARHNALF